jgi:hypothetical protein
MTQTLEEMVIYEALYGDHDVWARPLSIFLEHVTVDGTIQPRFKPFAEMMLALGCIEALNLDGGGSSTMVIEGQVINEPCGEIKENSKYVEAVSDAILIF